VCSKHIHQTQQNPSPSEIIRHKYFSLIKITITSLLCEDKRGLQIQKHQRKDDQKLLYVYAEGKTDFKEKPRTIAVIFQQMKKRF
jgi:hypothetical protein